MKKKILFLSALAAASTAFIGCSSDENLAEVPEVIEEPTATPEDEGTPLVVKLVDGNGTRGTDWTAITLPSFALYSVKNGGSERWLGNYSDAGVSEGTVFTNQEDPETGALTGDFSAGSVKWKDGNWDFYALSDATFASESDGSGGTQDAEHLDAEGGRNFTYVVNNDYNAQTDLLVAEVVNQSKSTPTVSLSFQHALAQIGQITFSFGELEEDNSDKYWIIKSITLHNLNSQGTYTFPETWSGSTGNDGTWSNLSLPTSYHIELPQFELDDYNNYKIFTETVDDEDEPNPMEFTSTAFAVGTKRCGTTESPVPNYFQCPIGNGTFSYAVPFAKKTGSEGDTFESYVATDATYTEDTGLYIIPQSLAKTVWEKNSSNEITGVESGVYAEIHGILLYRNDPTTTFDKSFNEEFEGSTGSWELTNVNNAWVTQLLNHEDYVGSYLVPLVKAKKELKAGKRYNLTFDLSKAVTVDSGDAVFQGAIVE